MKKNKMLRAASVLLIMVMLTTSIVGGTFAKYTTTGTASDTARVAKWGVVISAQSDLFATAYKDEKVDNNNATATVKTADTSKLVAPGTNGTGLAVTNTNTNAPEVSYSMSIKLGDDAEMPSLKYTPTGETTAKNYEPVTFSIYNGDQVLNDKMKLAEMKSLFEESKVIYEYDVAAQKYYLDRNLNGTIDSTEKDAGNALANAPVINIKWSWEFENSDATIKALNDELDTILGNTAAGIPITKYSGGGDNSVSDVKTGVVLNWTITATQID